LPQRVVGLFHVGVINNAADMVRFIAFSLLALINLKKRQNGGGKVSL
jgi:hypothetical protein